MAFSVNPLSLSIPQSSFEAWLRDSGYLEALDSNNRPNSSSSSSSWIPGRGTFSSLFKFVLNPLKGITPQDLCRDPASWTSQFWHSSSGLRHSYGWPHHGTQLKLRMQENMKRYMGNYIRLSLCILCCFLYKMPLALLGIISILGLWDTVRMVSKLWRLERDSFLHQFLLLLGKIVTAMIMIYCKVALALCWSALLSFGVVVLHSSLRKVIPQK